MELIKEVGLVSYQNKSGRSQQNMSGEFRCPSCGSAVVRPMAKGKRNKSCGAKECIEATRTSANQYSERTGPVLHYSGELPPSNKKSKLNTLYQVWLGMKKRCYNENEAKYKNYGAKGIIVCDEWKHSFDAFYEDMHQRYFEMKDAANGVKSMSPSIDRIDVNGNYELSNCEWITYSENSSKDLRIPVVRMDFNGEILATYASATEAANTFKSQMGCRMMSPGVPHILECCRGRRSEHVGYDWAFATNKTTQRTPKI